LTVFAMSAVPTMTWSTCARHGDADAEEWRMLCAIARSAAEGALAHGIYDAAFRGFRVRALRQAFASGVCVKLVVTGRSTGCDESDAASCAMILHPHDPHRQGVTQTQYLNVVEPTTLWQVR